MASNVEMAPHFVRQVNVYYGEELVMRADVDFTISENPVFRFYFLPQGEADLRAQVVDSSDLRFEQALTYTPKR
jgi:sulfur-oxidizing protein SoxY